MRKAVQTEGAATKVLMVVYFVLNPRLVLSERTLRELVDAGRKTCRGKHVEILREENSLSRSVSDWPFPPSSFSASPKYAGRFLSSAL